MLNLDYQIVVGLLLLTYKSFFPKPSLLFDITLVLYYILHVQGPGKGSDMRGYLVCALANQSEKREACCALVHRSSALFWNYDNTLKKCTAVANKLPTAYQICETDKTVDLLPFPTSDWLARAHTACHFLFLGPAHVVQYYDLNRNGFSKGSHQVMI